MTGLDVALQKIVQALQAGELDVDQALAKLDAVRAQQMPDAVIDHDRPRRCGSPEAIFAAGKSITQVIDIAQTLLDKEGYALITRAREEQVQALQKHYQNIEQHIATQAGTMLLGDAPTLNVSTIPIVTAGTSDLAVAEEAALTCKALGHPTQLITDVGVAGVHRLLHRLDDIRKGQVVICCAGMEGALPSVLGGLIDQPIIAAPTSVGYGTSFGGLTALLAMLNSCAAGIAVVNIDNGFGAACAACRMNRRLSTSG